MNHRFRHTLLITLLYSSTALSNVATQSTPVPNAVLTMHDGLQTTFNNFDVSLTVVANDLEQVGDQWVQCGLDFDVSNHNEHDRAALAECEIEALSILHGAYDQAVNAMHRFADELVSVKTDVETAYKHNNNVLDNYARDGKRYTFAERKLVSRITEIARTAPRPLSQSHHREVQKLRQELNNVQAHIKLNRQGTVHAEQSTTKFQIVLNAIDTWQFDAKHLARGYTLNNTQVNTMLQMKGNDISNQIILSQVNIDQIEGISNLAGTIAGFDLDGLTDNYSHDIPSNASEVAVGLNNNHVDMDAYLDQFTN